MVLGVVLPSPGWGIATEEVQRYAQPEFVFQEVVLVKGRVLRGLIETLASERARNGRKATALKWSLILLVPESCPWQVRPLSLGTRRSTSLKGRRRG